MEEEEKLGIRQEVGILILIEWDLLMPEKHSISLRPENDESAKEFVQYIIREENETAQRVQLLPEGLLPSWALSIKHYKSFRLPFDL